MTKTELDLLIDEYFRWLKNNTFSRSVNNVWSEIITPYVDRHNDCLVIYAKKDKDTITLTDDGYILDDLAASGCLIESEKRKKILETTLNSFGVKLVNEQLCVETDARNFPAKKHDLIQAMLCVNDLFFTNNPASSNLFLEDVISWFEEIDARYSKDIKLAGKSGLDNKFDFLIPKSKSNKERLVLTMNTPSADNAKNAIFRWVDCKEIRSSDSTLIVLMNDTEKKPSANIREGLERYDINPIFWSEKNSYRNLIAG